jgi:ankyrin repeat protein
MDNIDNKNPVNLDGKTPLEMAVKSNHSLFVNGLTNN